jgi:vacuolar-type H+-ATPase subunit H
MGFLDKIKEKAEDAVKEGIDKGKEGLEEAVEKGTNLGKKGFEKAKDTTEKGIDKAKLD